MSNFTIASILNLNPIKISESKTAATHAELQSRENDLNLNNTAHAVNTVVTPNFAHIAHQILQRSMSFPQAIPPALKVRPQNQTEQFQAVESELMIDESDRNEFDVNMNGNKKKRGRKKGSKNKPKDPNQQNVQKKVKRTKSENGKTKLISHNL